MMIVTDDGHIAEISDDYLMNVGNYGERICLEKISI